MDCVNLLACAFYVYSAVHNLKPRGFVSCVSESSFPNHFLALTIVQLKETLWVTRLMDDTFLRSFISFDDEGNPVPSRSSFHIFIPLFDPFAVIFDHIYPNGVGPTSHESQQWEIHSSVCGFLTFLLCWHVWGKVPHTRTRLDFFTFPLALHQILCGHVQCEFECYRQLILEV